MNTIVQFQGNFHLKHEASQEFTNTMNLIDFLILLTDSLENMNSDDKVLLELNKRTFQKFHSGYLKFLLEDCQLHNKENNELNKSSLELLIEKFNTCLKAFSDAYYYLNREIHAKTSFAEFIHNTVFKTETYNLFENHWALTKDNYQKYQKLMETYRSIFNGKIYENDNGRFYFPTFYSKTELIAKLKNIKDSLKKIMLDFQSQIEEFARNMNRNYNKLYIDIKTKFELINNQYSKLKLVCPNTPLQPGFLSLNKNLNEVYSKWQTLQKLMSELTILANGFDQNTVILSDVKSYADLELNISKLNYLLADWKSLSINQINQKAERLNTINYNASLASEICEKLNADLIALNDLKFTTNKLEINANNYYQICKEILKISGIIDDFILYVNREEDAIKLREFTIGLSHDEKLFISKLESCPLEVWDSCFKISANKKLLAFYYHPLTIESQDYALDLIHLKNEITQYLIDSCINKLKKLHLKNLSQHKAIVKKINSIKVKQDENNYIHYFSEQELKIIKEHKSIEIQIKESLDDNFVNFNISSQPRNFNFQMIDYESSELNDICMHMQSIHVTERYNVASLLSRHFIEYGTEFKLLQLKNANIISLYPEELQQILISNLDEYGVKEIHMKNDRINYVIESILEVGRKQILLTINGLLDYKNPESFEMQYEIIAAFKRLGFSVHNIWSVDLIHSKDRIFKTIVSNCLN